jgi:hypothetical protein
VTQGVLGANNDKLTTLSAVGAKTNWLLPIAPYTLVNSSLMEMSRIIWRTKFLFLMVAPFYNEMS